MSQETEQINQAIQVFLESIGETQMEAVEIIFKKRDAVLKDNAQPRNCSWVWDPIRQRLVWRC